jgi:hypothetical protein
VRVYLRDTDSALQAAMRYQKRVSGPLMERSPPHFAGRHPHRPQAAGQRALRALKKLTSDRLGEPSEPVQAGVKGA